VFGRLRLCVRSAEVESGELQRAEEGDLLGRAVATADDDPGVGDASCDAAGSKIDRYHGRVRGSDAFLVRDGFDFEGVAVSAQWCCVPERCWAGARGLGVEEYSGV
jgi:hypothetical protein